MIMMVTTKTAPPRQRALYAGKEKGMSRALTRGGMIGTEMYRISQLPSGNWAVWYGDEWVEASLPSEEAARQFVSEREGRLHSVNYISMVDRPDPQYHRSKIILHRDNMFYLAEFSSVEQLDEFARMMGFAYTQRKSETSRRFGWYREYDLDRKFKDWYGFNRLDQLPEGAKPFLGLSNGSVVTCYFTNDGETITIYRPNPNAHEVYQPLPLEEHIKHQMRFGII